MNPIVIAGSGLAGLAVAREFRRLDATTPVVVVTADDGTSYSKPMLSNALATGRSPAQLASASALQVAAQLGIELRAWTRIEAIDRDARQLRLGAGALVYDRLVLALGADPRRPALAGDGAGDVLTVNDLAGYAVFRDALAGARRVAILGAGLIGCEFANDIAASGIGIGVDVVDVAPHPLGRLLPPRAAAALRRALECAGVAWHLGRTPQAVRRRASGHRLSIALDDGSEIAADVVLSATGLVPRTGIAAAAGLATGRGILTDRLLRSVDPAIFALGDCAEVEGLSLPFVMPLMTCARALARTLSGTPTPVAYPAMPVVVKTPALPVVVAPPPAAARGAWQEDDTADGIAARFMGEDGTMHGFALVGATAVARKAEMARAIPAWL
jgi:rubredoxin-NAD+ reductase